MAATPATDPARALEPPPHATLPLPPQPSVFSRPAPSTAASKVDSAPASILDPFSVYDKSPDLLAQELTALRGWHLRQIIRDYDLAPENDTALESLSEPELGSLILRRVRELHA